LPVSSEAIILNFGVVAGQGIPHNGRISPPISSAAYDGDGEMADQAAKQKNSAFFEKKEKYAVLKK